MNTFFDYIKLQTQSISWSKVNTYRVSRGLGYSEVVRVVRKNLYFIYERETKLNK